MSQSPDPSDFLSSLFQKFGKKPPQVVNLADVIASHYPEEFEKDQKFHQLGETVHTYQNLSFTAQAIQYTEANEDHEGNLLAVLNFMRANKISYLLEKGEQLSVLTDDRSSIPLENGSWIVNRDDVNAYRVYSCGDFKQEYALPSEASPEAHEPPSDTNDENDLYGL